MKTYKKGNKIINASEKAYELIYKNQGYKPYDETDKPLTSLTVDKLKLKAQELGIENFEELKKSELVDAINEKIEDNQSDIEDVEDNE